MSCVLKHWETDLESAMRGKVARERAPDGTFKVHDTLPAETRWTTKAQVNVCHPRLSRHYMASLLLLDQFLVFPSHMHFLSFPFLGLHFLLFVVLQFSLGMHIDPSSSWSIVPWILYSSWGLPSLPANHCYHSCFDTPRGWFRAGCGRWKSREMSPWQDTQGAQHLTCQAKIISTVQMEFCCSWVSCHYKETGVPGFHW